MTGNPEVIKGRNGKFIFKKYLDVKRKWYRVTRCTRKKVFVMYGRKGGDFFPMYKSFYKSATQKSNE